MGIKAQITYEDKLNMLKLYQDKVPVTKIAKQYKISATRVYTILNEPEIVELQKQYEAYLGETFIKGLLSKGMSIIDLFDLYIAEGMKQDRIDETSLRDLSTFYGVLADKQLRLLEIAAKRQEDNKGTANTDNGLLNDFINVIKDNDTLPKNE
jgi:hypothetical protein